MIERGWGAVSWRPSSGAYSIPNFTMVITAALLEKMEDIQNTNSIHVA